MSNNINETLETTTSSLTDLRSKTLKSFKDQLSGITSRVNEKLNSLRNYSTKEEVLSPAEEKINARRVILKVLFEELVEMENLNSKIKDMFERNETYSKEKRVELETLSKVLEKSS